MHKLIHVALLGLVAGAWSTAQADDAHWGAQHNAQSCGVKNAQAAGRYHQTTAAAPRRAGPADVNYDGRVSAREHKAYIGQREAARRAAITRELRAKQRAAAIRAREAEALRLAAVRARFEAKRRAEARARRLEAKRRAEARARRLEARRRAARSRMRHRERAHLARVHITLR